MQIILNEKWLLLLIMLGHCAQAKAGWLFGQAGCDGVLVLKFIYMSFFLCKQKRHTSGKLKTPAVREAALRLL